MCWGLPRGRDFFFFFLFIFNKMKKKRKKNKGAGPFFFRKDPVVPRLHGVFKLVRGGIFQKIWPVRLAVLSFPFVVRVVSPSLCLVVSC